MANNGENGESVSMKCENGVSENNGEMAYQSIMSIMAWQWQRNGISIK
jgi:hypothetical protein